MKNFMQGLWIKVPQYKVLLDTSVDERTKIVEEWNEKYAPDIDTIGEYPGYYNY